MTARWRSRGSKHAGGWLGAVTLAAAALGVLGAGCKANEDAVARKVEARLEKKMRQEVDRQVRKQLRATRDREGLAAREHASGVPALPVAAPGPGRPAAAAAVGAGGGAAPAGQPSVGAAAGETAAPLPNGPPPKVTADEQGLTIAQVVAARRVVERKPSGAGTSFSVGDGRVYCFVDARNPKGPERKIEVIWQHQGKVFHKVHLRVGVGYIWRTWAYVRLRPAHVGAWRCTVRNEQGAVLGSADFQVAAGGEGTAPTPPVRSVPVRSVPVRSVPVRSVPVRSVPVRSVPRRSVRPPGSR